MDPSPIDLTTLDDVKRRAQAGVAQDGSIAVTPDDDEIQAAITGFSRFLLNKSGMSSLNSVVTLNEIYDGNGNRRMFLRTYPIVTLVGVLANGVALPVSSGQLSFGVFIDQAKKSISLRGGNGFATTPYWGGRTGRGPVFPPGVGNISVQYTAGNAETPEDLEYAVRCVVALNYKRKAWQDQASRGVNAAGTGTTTRYRDWAWPPEYDQVFDLYSRVSFIA